VIIEDGSVKDVKVDAKVAKDREHDVRGTSVSRQSDKMRIESQGADTITGTIPVDDLTSRDARP
jgi:hypothetical protein